MTPRYNPMRRANAGRKLSMMVAVGAGLCAIMLTACQEASIPVVTELAAETPGFNMTLHPTLNTDKEVDAIEVEATLTGGLEPGAEAFKLMAPVVYVNVQHIADRITDLEVTDAKGAVAFTTQDDEPVPGGYPYFRHWTAERPVEFPVRISYRALVQPEGGPRGPAFGIRPSAGGISGAGAGFLLVPENAASRKSTLDWDLTAFDQPSVGVTTFGNGRVEVPGAPYSVMQGWYMAGPAEQYPDAGVDTKFHAYWLGNFPFDEREAMAFTSEMYTYFETYFDHLDPAPEYRVFMRLLDTPPYGGGTALANSFMLSRGPLNDDEVHGESPKSTFVHELLHQWSGSLSGDAIGTNWFSEGLTTYFEYTLPFRAGHVSFDEYVAGLNKMSRDYYTTKASDWPISEIKKVGFGDDDIRHVPYQRGALYFADLDARLRNASDGKRGLHAFLSPILKAREAGDVDLTTEAWSQLVSDVLGGDELSLVQAVHTDGMTFFPAPDSFGRCIVGERTVYERDGERFEGMRWVPVPDITPDACFEDD
ncbi:MAG: hypothetical protein KJ871_08250 [Alphaproteobacteria bacterium]|nr:hypothetical protein [Alphaproteobacteria bacterium]MBU2085771.1 hypothetical protein [Alphaproteobacteria bacterium]MBU2142355.1 hypothetical protein [Alphaproteobacteria bacterium]MBU2197223.1 hypothetical protein [Alphaproteobacteria bacterium]